jgi:hypothetical protein
MALTIEQIEAQIADLQATLEKLKNPKMEVSRHFTGQYFAPYQGVQYRRMESDGVPIWETFLDIKKEWVTLNSQEVNKLEETYLKDCVSSNQQENVENFMN